MNQQADLEALLRAHGEALDAEVGPRPGLEERILTRADATPPAVPRRVPLFRELAVASVLLVLAGAAGFGAIRLRAAHQATLAKTPVATTTAASSPTASPAPTLGPHLAYKPGITMFAGPLEIGSAFTETPLRMFTALRGWAVGPAGKGQGDHDGLLVTADGGQHWRNVTPPGTSGWTDRTNFFLDLGHAWVAVTPHVVQHPTTSALITVYRTSDGGQSWTSASFQVTDGGPSQIDFVDPTHGWLVLQVTGGDAIYRTSDGGVSWELASVSRYIQSPDKKAAPGTLPLANAYGPGSGNRTACDIDPFAVIAFVDPSTGWATGRCTGPSPQPYFYVTRDAGSTWEPQVLPEISANMTCPCWVSSTHPRFTSARVGTVTFTTGIEHTTCQAESGGTQCASESIPLHTYLDRTSDGGNTWTASALPGLAAFGDSPSFIDGRSGWMSAEVPAARPTYPGELAFDKLYITHDGGVTWSPLQTGGTFPGGSLDFTNATEGWALPNLSDLPLTLLHTSDGGRSWEKLFPYVAG